MHSGTSGYPTSRAAPAKFPDGSAVAFAHTHQIAGVAEQAGEAALKGMVSAKCLTHKGHLRQEGITGSGLPFDDDAYLMAGCRTVIDGKPWHDGPMKYDHAERHAELLIAACYVVVSYLSGMRPGEVLIIRPHTPKRVASPSPASGGNPPLTKPAPKSQKGRTEKSRGSCILPWPEQWLS